MVCFLQQNSDSIEEEVEADNDNDNDNERFLAIHPLS